MAVIGVDIGGTKLALALFTEAGELRARRTAAVAGRGGGEVGALIVAELRALLAAPEAAANPVRAVGLAVPGIYHAATGRVWAPNLPGWDDYPLRDEVRAALTGGGGGPIAVRVDSDRAAYILGEAWRGAARGCRNAIYLAVGTGIGAGILVEGEVLRGARDIAGAVGWLALDRGYRAGYAETGCFEHHASGPGLARIARELLAGAPETERGAHLAPGPFTTADVFAAYDAGDEVAVQVVEEAIGYWGMAAANLVSVFDPEVLIFGGGVFGPAARLLDRIRAEAARWAQPISMPAVRFAVSELGGDAGLYGAGQLALRAATEPSI
jgi:glucokinase